MGNSSVQIRHLVSFTTLAEDLHFTKAAARLHFTQQTLSHQIRQLEDALEIRLFDRSTRKVELTEAGKIFAQRCESILTALDSAIAETERAANGQPDSLRLAYTPSFAGIAFATRDSLLAQHPDVRFSMVECWAEQALSGTMNGDYHAAFVHGGHEPHGLASSDAGAVEVGVILGASDPLAELDAVPRDSLLQRVLVLWPHELSPLMFASMQEMFPQHFEAGNHYEFESLSQGLFLGDDHAVDLILAAQGFTPGVEQQIRRSDSSFVWRPMTPGSSTPALMVHRADAAADSSGAGLILAAVSELFPGGVSPVRAKPAC